MEITCEGCISKDDEIKYLREELKDWKDRFHSFIPEAMNSYQQATKETFMPTRTDDDGKIIKADEDLNQEEAGHVKAFNT